MSRDAAAFALDEGHKLDAAAADLLEEHLREYPTDIDARLKLLGFLFRRHRTSPELARRRVAHIVWFIEHEPAHEIVGSPLADLFPSEQAGLTEATAAWATHLAKPDVDPEALLRAARFFTLVAPEESRKLLEQGERLRPDWAIWGHELAELTMRPVTVALAVALTGRTPALPTLDADACRREAAVALAHLERALRLCSDDAQRFSYLPDAATAGLEAGANEKARAFAEEILRLAPGQTANRHHLDHVHVAHITLGRVALESGDVARAIEALAAAGKVGSRDAPVLRSFGPDFSLAGRLYDRGETAAVFVYLDECARFWNPKRIAFWREQIARGEKPRLHRGFDPDLP